MPIGTHCCSFGGSIYGVLELASTRQSEGVIELRHLTEAADRGAYVKLRQQRAG
jgi:hypothetical protein